MSFNLTSNSFFFYQNKGLLLNTLSITTIRVFFLANTITRVKVVSSKPCLIRARKKEYYPCINHCYQLTSSDHGGSISFQKLAQIKDKTFCATLWASRLQLLGIFFHVMSNDFKIRHQSYWII